MGMAAQRISISILLLLLCIFSVSVPSYTKHLPSSQAQALLGVQKLLNYPPVLSNWNASTDFCNIEPTPSLTVVCYEKSITQLHIFGNKGTPSFPQNFSVESFFNTLVGLPTLKVLSLVSLGLWGTLPSNISRLSSLEILNISSNFFYGDIPQEISSLTSLQTLILDNNLFTGRVPVWLSDLPVLTVLSLRNNSLTGYLPNSLSSLENLRVLALSMNRLSGQVPDLSSLRNLQVLDLEDNYFGPQFPSLGSKLVSLVMRKNRFSSAIDAEVSSYYQLEQLDISFNRFVGPFPPALLSLPSITYLNISGNKFTGMLLENMSCNAELGFVDLSSNLLTGRLPTCLLTGSKNRVIRYARNCLATADQNQHPFFFCRNEALAVGIIPSKQNKPRRAAKAMLALITVGGVLAGIALVGLIIFLVVRRENAKKMIKTPPPRSITENVSTGYSSKLLSDARYISQTMRLGALGLPSYRAFSLEELEGATNNFHSSAFLGEGSHGQMYRGRLSDGSLVAIRCLKVKGRHSTQNFMHHIELILKLRHHHLVSSLGHCFECYLDDSSVSRIFLIFEYVPNGTLRGHISEGPAGQKLTWAQRIAAVVGVAKGIQYLHTGIVPGVFSNNLKITDILLDQSLVAKISSYNLPLLTENMGKTVSNSFVPLVCRTKHEDKIDVYDFGVILLEIIVGRSITSRNEVDIVKDQLQVGIMADDAARRSIVDPEVREGCSDESLKTVMDICYRTLSNDPTERPSVEDVLWNLQFAAQVQEEWGGDSGSTEGSPVSPCQPPPLQLTSH
ncbi:Protein kinase domain [Macleaya cordata]|uniref:Protein kinase domain n=1 Tax=Macleaya cordata TaxID=56857 RepID=A0A200PRN2_MACCD|nr:Protein kinase domain [Macleaya cordata]